MKSIDELAEDLVYKGDDGALPLRQYEHAKKLLADNPKLVEALRRPFEVKPIIGDPLSRLESKGSKRVYGNVVEFPLGQQQPLNAWRNQGAWAEKLTVRAIATANAIRKYRRAVVISLYNERAQKNELVIAKTAFRAVCKLIWFRFTMWAKKHLNRE